MTIPAMTSQAEQDCFERIARECAPYGAVVELGAWLGACTVAVARGIERSGVQNVVHSYDRFRWNPRTHGAKSGLPITTNAGMFKEYCRSIEPVRGFVRVHKGEITDARWEGGPISFLLCDGPKRLFAVQHTLSEFGTWLRSSSVMAWQDFGFPPAYAIPASLYRLRDHFAFREAEGYTAIFNIASSWTKDEVALAKLEDGWTIPEVAGAVDHWRACLPDECYAATATGLALFLSDLGHIPAAKALLAATDSAPLRRLRETHGRLMSRYPDLR